MKVISRYDQISLVSTPLNPIEDLLSWLAGLNSIGYTSDILRTVHSFSNTKEIHKCARLISLYTNNALGLTEQAYSGPSDVSFLPLYYAILNLSKVYIILSGREADLSTNRHHGATYDVASKSSRDLLTEAITLRSGGVLPLLYETLTGIRCSWKKKPIRLRTIYPYIRGIGYEYQHAYGMPSALQIIRLGIKGDSEGGYYLEYLFGNTECAYAGQKQYLKVVKSFRQLFDESIHSEDEPVPSVFLSKRVFVPTEEQALISLTTNIRRFLLYETILSQPDIEAAGCFTPVSNRELLLPEEIPIWIAFFHLSNLVRYKPEFLHAVKDSRSWPMLLSLRKHAFLRFMIIFWSYLHQKEYRVLGE